MCGIAGVAMESGIGPVETEGLGWMSDALVHRGPDGSGLHQGEKVALAVRRLAIIDPEGGWQPLHNEDGSLVLVANGEIYNHPELRRGLESRGHRFATGSDCETILHLYEERGPDCVHALRGMFAFALWDVRRQVLVLARDRMGEKPLYLYETPGRLIFASELNSLLRSGLVPLELDPGAIHSYFHFNYVPEPATPIRGVRKLDAAHVFVLHVDGWRSEERCYWRIEDAEPLDGEPVELIRSELETVSGLTLRSDVPVGLALSGGLDSGALAALCARRGAADFHCFSIGYEGRPPSDERAGARVIAAHAGLPLHEVELTTADLVDHFPGLVRATDDPVADISAFGYWSVYRAAAEHGVRVLLSGQGADELFWGYPWVAEAARQSEEKAAYFQSGFGAWRSAVRQGGQGRRGGRAGHGGSGSALGWRRSSIARLAGYLAAPRDSLVFYDLLREYQAPTSLGRNLFTPEFRAAVPNRPGADVFPIPIELWGNVPVRISALIARTYLRGNGIVQGDRLSMASSVEQRLPFLDHRLWEVVQGLRKVHPDHNLSAKSWLRSAVADLLPARVLNQPKRGFTPPIRSWIAALLGRYGEEMTEGALVRAGIATRSGLAKTLQPDAPSARLAFPCLILGQWLEGLTQVAATRRPEHV
jgi:asparagine synthase (glutamine-hydrolysing)